MSTDCIGKKDVPGSVNSEFQVEKRKLPTKKNSQNIEYIKVEPDGTIYK